MIVPVPPNPVSLAYASLLHCWNVRDAAAFAALFTPDGVTVGFDGSVMNGRAEIEAALSAIFAHHETASYVAKVREVRALGAGITLLQAVAGMVPPGQSDLNPAVNAVQSMVAVSHGPEPRIALFQNTPAQFHGRPELSAALTEELRALLKDQHS